MSDGPEAARGALPVAPALIRRMSCMLYEGVLLFGVLMAFGYLYSSLTQQRHALQGTTGLQVFLFVVLGIYFVGFWSNGGQTLAMKTWRIRLVMQDGTAVSQRRALLRYLFSWLWFLPALASTHYSGVRSPVASLVVVAAGIAAYLLLAWLRRDRQFLHDVLCGTRLVDVGPSIPKSAQSAV